MTKQPPAKAGGSRYQEREARLNTDGWRVHIQRKAKRGKPQSECQKRRNTRITRPRARVEHRFGAYYLWLKYSGERV